MKKVIVRHTFAGLFFALASLLSAAPSTVDGREAAPTRAQPLYVEVRSSMDDLWNGTKKRKPEPHGRVYYILSMRLTESVDKLKTVVDEPAMAAELRRALNAEGYREVTGSEKPDILLSVHYGRGYVKNPYLSDTADQISEGEPITSVTDPKQVFAQRQIGYEEKRQRAQLQKLFITVRALQYPKTPKEKPKRLWQTTMLMDNPDSYDLNLVAKDMFALGAQHFDRVLEKEGITISTDNPKGRVIMAPLRVVEEIETPPPAEK